MRVVVIGGGPAGTTCAGFLAKAGHSVDLFERATYPRGHVGESLLTSFPYILGLLGPKYVDMVVRGVRFSG